MDSGLDGSRMRQIGPLRTPPTSGFGRPSLAPSGNIEWLAASPDHAHGPHGKRRRRALEDGMTPSHALQIIFARCQFARSDFN